MDIFELCEKYRLNTFHNLESRKEQIRFMKGVPTQELMECLSEVFDHEFKYKEAAIDAAVCYVESMKRTKDLCKYL